MNPVALTVDELRSIEPRFSRLEEAPIQLPGGANALAWHSNALSDSRAIALGSGVGPTREIARRVALAETLERACIRKLRDSSDAVAFGLDRYPTSCGFAAGFESENTRMRSICEAVERWARALWIDEHYVLSPIAGEAISLSPLSKYFLAQFEKTLFFAGQFSVADPIRKNFIELKLGVVVGFDGAGVFPGARVCSADESPWEHACLEAWRHQQIVQKGGLKDIPVNSYLHRISYFATHRDAAVEQIQKANRYDWPRPEIKVHRSLEVIPKKLFIWRSICGDFQGWEKGSISRFVY